MTGGLDEVRRELAEALSRARAVLDEVRRPRSEPAADTPPDPRNEDPA